MDAQNIRPENNVSKDFLYRWQKPGDERRTDIPAIIGKGDDNYPLYERHWSDSKQGIQPIAVSPWDMYDYGNHRVVSGNYLKCSNLSLTYEFKEEASFVAFGFDVVGDESVYGVCQRIERSDPYAGRFCRNSVE